MKNFVTYLLLLLSLCSCISTKRNIEKVKSELLREKQLWENFEIKDYNFRISNVRTGGIVQLFDSTIVVKNGHYFSEIVENNKNEFYNYLFPVNEVFQKYTTIDNLYNSIEEFIESYDKKLEKEDYTYGYCNNITIEYNYNNHIPIRIEYDYWHNPFVNVSDRLKYYAIDIIEFKIE
jgi:hypothetical protein